MATSRPPHRHRAPVLECRVLELPGPGLDFHPKEKGNKKRKKRKEKENVTRASRGEMTDMAVTVSSLITESSPGETAPANCRSLALRSWRKSKKKIVRRINKKLDFGLLMEGAVRREGDRCGG